MYKLLILTPLFFLLGCKADSSGIIRDIPLPPVAPLILNDAPHTSNLFTSVVSSGGYKVNISIQDTPQFNFNLSNGYSVELSVK